MKKGMLIVISAPAGCGKDTIIKGLLEEYNGLCYSVSATTRAIREDEVDGEHYFFKTREEFEQLIQLGELLEHTQYCGNYYGTLRSTVINALDAGKNIILKIEIEGAAKIRQLFSDCLTIFILPPSMDELRRRLKNRASEDEETIDRRIQKASDEIVESCYYDYQVTNDDLPTAINVIGEIIIREKTKRNVLAETPDANENE